MQGVAEQSQQVPLVIKHNRPPPLEDPVPCFVDQTAVKERTVHLKMIEGQIDRREATAKTL
jgi:hypothetical protein